MCSIKLHRLTREPYAQLIWHPTGSDSNAYDSRRIELDVICPPGTIVRHIFTRQNSVLNSNDT